MTLLVIALAVAGTATLAVCCGALAEAFAQLAEVRAAMRLDDRPLPLALTRSDFLVTDVGLPAAIALQPEVIVVFLSIKCGTCLAIAEAFRGGSPASVWFVVAADDFDEPTRITQALRESQERLVVDRGNLIADAVGLDVTPTVVTVQFGRVIRAEAVSSARQVMSVLPTVRPSGVTLGTAVAQPPVSV